MKGPQNRKDEEGLPWLDWKMLGLQTEKWAGVQKLGLHASCTGDFHLFMRTTVLPAWMSVRTCMQHLHMHGEQKLPFDRMLVSLHWGGGS